jgi:hypothetical protein
MNGSRLANRLDPPQLGADTPLIALEFGFDPKALGCP